jgi:branched-chain amino acid transport system substrate-binding protein
MANNNSKGLKIGLAVVVVALIVAAGAYYLFSPNKPESIKIGAIIPMSGPASHLSVVGEGLQYVVDELNVWGGINGRPIELIIADSQSKPDIGKKMFLQIEETHHPVLYISVTSSVSIAVAPLAEQYQVPVAGLVVSASNFTKLNPWLFRYYFSAQNEAATMLPILKELKTKKLGILYQNDAYGLSVLKKLQQTYGKAGGFITSEPFSPGEPDLNQQINKLKKMEAIYAVGFSRDLHRAVKQLKAASYPGAIMAASGITASEATNGVYTAAPIIYNPKNSFANDIRQKYETKTNKPFTHYIATGYDFLQLVSALMIDKEVNRQTVKRALESGFSHNGVFGSFDVQPGERDIYFPLYPVQIRNGKLVF